MDGMDGWSVLSALKADPATHDIPVMMLTVTPDEAMSYALGMDDWRERAYINWCRSKNREGGMARRAGSAFS